MTGLRTPLIRRAIRHFARDDAGSGTLLSLFIVAIIIVMAGLAIDFNKAMADRTRLQVAADTAAHAALYSRETMPAAEARTKAINVIDMMLRDDLHGGAVTESDVEFGIWDNDTLTFTASENSLTAVRVFAAKTEERGNAARNLLLNIIGFDTFNVTTQSVYSTYYPPCFTEGFVADGLVDVQSNNSFSEGFCLHSNDHVSVNQDNYFQSGTVVSMPNLADLDMPQSGFEQNDGLEAALRAGIYRIRILNRLPQIIDGLWLGDTTSLPTAGRLQDDGTLIGSEHPIDTYAMPSALSVDPADFMVGVVNTMQCGGGGKVTMGPGVYQNIAFVSDCEVTFANGVQLEDTLVATTHTGAQSMKSPSGFTLGRNDNCAPGGGSILLTLGGFSVASSLNVFNGQIIALGNIEFAADADGIQGASFVAGGEISGTSNMSMGFCSGAGMENMYRASYFRMID